MLCFLARDLTLTSLVSRFFFSFFFRFLGDQYFGSKWQPVKMLINAACDGLDHLIWSNYSTL